VVRKKTTIYSLPERLSQSQSVKLTFQQTLECTERRQQYIVLTFCFLSQGKNREFPPHNTRMATKEIFVYGSTKNTPSLTSDYFFLLRW